MGHAGELRATVRVSWLWTRLAGAAVVEGCTGFAFHLLCFWLTKVRGSQLVLTVEWAHEAAPGASGSSLGL